MTQTLSKPALALGLCLPGLAFAAGWAYATGRESPSVETSSPPPPESRPETKAKTSSRGGRNAWQFRKLAESDPVFAAEEAGEMPEHRSADATMAAAAHWTASDPLAAMAWIDSLPPSDLADKAHRMALAVWCNVDPDAAMAHFAALPTEEQFAIIRSRFKGDHLFRTAIGRTGGPSYFSSPARAILWSAPLEKMGPLLDVMSTSEDKRVREHARSKRAEALLATDPDAALAFSIEEDFASQFLGTMASAAPRAAFDLSQRHGMPADSVIEQWTKLDHQAARTAIGEISDPILRKSAHGQWLDQMIKVDPALAARSFSAANTDAPDRARDYDYRQRLRKSFEAWFLNAPEAATRQAAKLSENDRKELSTTLRNQWAAQGVANPYAKMAELGFESP